MRFFAFVGLAALAMAGCSASPASETSKPTVRRPVMKDAGENPDPPDPDAGVPTGPGNELPANFAAAHPPFPQVIKQAGPILPSPKFVAVTFPDETLRPQIEDFMTSIGTTGYWTATTSEYGIGAGAAGTPVRLASLAPPQIDDADIQTFIKASIAEGLFGTFDPSNIYVIYYPQTTTVTLQGAKSCESFGGYHSEVTLSDGQKAIYATIPRCPDFVGLNGIDMVTVATSHELIEASTDPYFFTSPAYQGEAEADFAWSSILGGGETADLCAQNDGVHFKPDGYPYMVQRSWSNAAAAVGTDPCVPARPSIYFNAAPVLPDLITLASQTGQMSVTGVKILPGSSKTIEIDLFSLAPTSGEWTLAVTDRASLMGAPAELQFQFDKASGTNGDKVHLTITALAADSSGSPFIIQSKLNGATNLFVGMVGQ